jgi:hypothetical protein
MILPNIDKGSLDSLFILRSQAWIFTVFDHSGGSPGASAYKNKLSKLAWLSISGASSETIDIKGEGIVFFI